MFKIQTLNKISPIGLEIFPRGEYEVASEILNPDAILVRSAKMHDMQIPASVKAIARAGAGVNNIPLDICTEKGIVVFNTPGANANGVKELTIAALLLASRKIVEGIAWAKSLAGTGEDIAKAVEKGKSQFTGPEILGKKLGVIGLGAIGVTVANAAEALGMQVIGYDPFISVEAAWGLSQNVKRALGLESLLAEADYISIHAPLSDKTKGMINRDRFTLMKKGVRIINLARSGLVNNADLAAAIAEGVVACYVTDFPDEDLLKLNNVIGIPHLGASTPESEDNCAIMAVKQICNFLENGNIKNGVNFPDCEMHKSAATRLLIANKNVPGIVGQISATLAARKLNISDMLNKHKGDAAFNIIDIDGKIGEAELAEIKKVDGVIMVRVIDGKK